MRCDDGGIIARDERSKALQLAARRRRPAAGLESAPFLAALLASCSVLWRASASFSFCLLWFSRARSAVAKPSAGESQSKQSMKVRTPNQATAAVLGEPGGPEGVGGGTERVATLDFVWLEESGRAEPRTGRGPSL